MVCAPFAGPHNAHVNDSDRSFVVAGKDTGTPERIGHPCNQHVTAFEEGAAEFLRLRAGEESVRSVAICTVADISQLDEANVAVRVLIHAFNPVAIDEHAARTDEFADLRPAPTVRKPRCLQRCNWSRLLDCDGAHAARVRLSSSMSGQRRGKAEGKKMKAEVIMGFHVCVFPSRATV